uniref:Uncharacterized protein n=1 Tax=Solanum tuberosum TaxID=4113 RepID=M1CPH8_SOLTU
MTRTRSMASLPNPSPTCSFEVDVLSLSSNSSKESLGSPSPYSKKRASSAKKKALKKPCPNASRYLSPEEMQHFWGVKQKNMYNAFKSRSIVPGRVININQLRDSYCPVSSFL